MATKTGEKVEITPDMINAGIAVDRWYDWYATIEESGEEKRIKDIFVAMMKVYQESASR